MNLQFNHMIVGAQKTSNNPANNYDFRAVVIPKIEDGKRAKFYISDNVIEELGIDLSKKPQVALSVATDADTGKEYIILFFSEVGFNASYKFKATMNKSEASFSSMMMHNFLSDGGKTNEWNAIRSISKEMDNVFEVVKTSVELQAPEEQHPFIVLELHETVEEEQPVNVQEEVF